MEDEGNLDGFERHNDSAWFAAIRAADTWRDAARPGPKKSGDMGQLVDLLRTRLVDASAVTLTREECELLVDLLSRHQLKQKAGGRKVPAYKRASWAELKLEIAAESVRYYQSKGLSLDQAVDRVATEYTSKDYEEAIKRQKGYVEAKPEMLELAEMLKLRMTGRRGSARRLRLAPKPSK
jgi:hypothetical protein